MPIRRIAPPTEGIIECWEVFTPDGTGFVSEAGSICLATRPDGECESGTCCRLAGHEGLHEDHWGEWLGCYCDLCEGEADLPDTKGWHTPAYVEKIGWVSEYWISEEEVLTEDEKRAWDEERSRFLQPADDILRDLYGSE